MNPISFLEPVAERFHKATVEDIRAIETLAGGQLPPPYVSFLQRYGAAMFSGEARVKPASGSPLSLLVLYAASGARSSVVSDFLAHPDYATAGFVPIADDPFNNRYVLALETGEVLFLEYGNGVNKAVKVAPSFEAFMNCIEVVPDEAL